MNAMDGYKHNKDYYVCDRCIQVVKHIGFYGHIRRYHTAVRKVPNIILPKPEDTIIEFNITNKRDLQLIRIKYFIVYGDFEANDIKCDGKIKQKPNSYCLFCPGLYDAKNMRRIWIVCPHLLNLNEMRQ